jgi:hypothetical protein
METLGKRICGVAAIGCLSLCMTAAVNAADVPSELGPYGEITNWLVLGYIPIPAGSNTWRQSFDTDLLAAVGGETNAQPAGGQTVTLPPMPGVGSTATSFTWRVTPSRPPGMPGIWSKTQFVPLFSQPGGGILENTAAYLYCLLMSPDEADGCLLVGSDDSMKLYLNGRLLHRHLGQRSAGENSEEVGVHLRKGANTLLVRVDNYVGNGGFYGRLVETSGAPMRRVKSQVAVAPETLVLENPRPRATPWTELVQEIPPVPPEENQELFGARLARTMTLLETGGLTHRPVRIVFYGQSIETEWTSLLIERLRERYPDTEIVAENWARGGCFVHVLLRFLKHDILRQRPDLFLFHAYQGNQDNWERLLTMIRRETCADIVIRTEHMGKIAPEEDDQSLMIRGLAQKYDCELVEIRRNEIRYLQQHNLDGRTLLLDGIHLNHKGSVLMAELYERHFRVNTLTRSGWTDRVQWYEALHPFETRKTDEITYAGNGWKQGRAWVESSSTNDALRLTFTGNRVDVVLAPCKGGARILIDGKPPSAWNLYHGTLPTIRTRRMMPPSWIARYFEGPDMRAETWEMTFDNFSVTNRRTLFDFHIRGSVTGEDGGGRVGQPFTSKSGRISIAPEDFGAPDDKYTIDPSRPAPILTWDVVADFLDEVHGTPVAKYDWFKVPYSYLTVADGLPYGEHEITLIPLGDAPVFVRGFEVYDPPMARITSDK